MTPRPAGLVALALLLPTCVLGLAAAQDGATSRGDLPLTVATTFHPTTYFAKRIGGDLVDVTCPLPDDADPAFWQPDRETIARYQKADLIVVNGAGFERWLDSASLPAGRLVDTTKPLAKELIVIESAVTHSHGKTGEHSHEGIDGHTWLDPVNAKAQAREILNALVKRRPESKPAFESRFAALEKDLDDLDSQWKALGSQREGERLLASHPAYNYLARRYGWRIRSFDLDPSEMPSEEQWKGLREALAEMPSRFLLWEDEPKPEIRERAKSELKLESVTVRPGENPGKAALDRGEDFLAIQRANCAALSPCFERAP